MEDHGGGVFYWEGEKVEITDNAIALADCGLGEVVMHKLNGVRKEECFCYGINYMEAAVVIECWPMLKPQKSQDFPVEGLLWMMTEHPMGPMGVASKLKGSL